MDHFEWTDTAKHLEHNKQGTRVSVASLPGHISRGLYEELLGGNFRWLYISDATVKDTFVEVVCMYVAEPIRNGIKAGGGHMEISEHLVIKRKLVFALTDHVLLSTGNLARPKGFRRVTTTATKTEWLDD